MLRGTSSLGPLLLFVFITSKTLNPSTCSGVSAGESGRQSGTLIPLYSDILQSKLCSLRLSASLPQFASASYTSLIITLRDSDRIIKQIARYDVSLHIHSHSSQFRKHDGFSPLIYSVVVRSFASTIECNNETRQTFALVLPYKLFPSSEKYVHLMCT
jgi:hypothetical protein